MSRLQSRRGPASDSGAYVPTRSEIEAQTAQFRARKLEALANQPDPAETERQIAREKLRKNRRAEIEAAAAKIEANRFNEPDDYQPKCRVPVGPEGPREMSKSDICNVEFIDSQDLDSVFDSLIESVSFQHALEDCECRWNVADVDPDMMDLRDEPPFKGNPNRPYGIVR